MKKVLIIGLIAAGFAFASASRSDAGVSVGIGIGVPVGYGCYPYGYGYGYYRYARPYYPAVVVGPSWYWYHGHRVYYHPRAHRYWRH